MQQLVAARFLHEVIADMLQPVSQCFRSGGFDDCIRRDSHRRCEQLQPRCNPNGQLCFRPSGDRASRLANVHARVHAGRIETQIPVHNRKRLEDFLSNRSRR